MEVGDLNIPVPIKKDSTTIWIFDSSADEVASELEAGLEKSNQPLHSFSFGYALRRLAESVRTVRAARAAEAGSPVRLDGLLELLVNRHWAITTYGLESLLTEHAFPFRPRGFDSRGVAHLASVTVANLAQVKEMDGFVEALRWVSDREHWQVVEPEPRA